MINCVLVNEKALMNETNEDGDRASDSFKKLILFANRTYTLLLI